VFACGNAPSDSAHLLDALNPDDFHNPWFFPPEVFECRSCLCKSPLAFRPVVCGIYVSRILYSYRPQAEEKKSSWISFIGNHLAKTLPTGRDCQFCHRVDPDFTKRDPMDRLVLSKLDDTAAAHLPEDGYIKHRIAELVKKRALGGIDTSLAKSA
jgi:hypothetical protein